MKTIHKCLFGGALLGAGLCSTATAGDVDWLTGYGRVAVSDGGSGSDYDTNLLSGDGWDATAAIGAASARSYAGTFGLDLAADGGAYSGFGSANTRSTFQVLTDTSFLIDWDTFVIGGYISGSIEGLVNIFSSTSGSFEHTFLKGQTYTVLLAISSFGSGSLSTFSMGENTVNVVPLQPAAFGGLAMLAGLGAYRRVRRH